MPPTLRELRKQEDRRRILRTALDLVQAQGYEATTIRDITAASGVALGTFFNHFPTKEHLLVDYYAQLQQEVSDRLSRPHRSFRAFMKAFTRLLTGQVQTHPRLYQAIGGAMLACGALQDAERAACGDMHRRIRKAIEKGAGTGELRADLDPEATASLLLLAFNGAILDTLPNLDGAAFEARLHHYLDPLLRLLQA